MSVAPVNGLTTDGVITPTVLSAEAPVRLILIEVLAKVLGAFPALAAKLNESLPATIGFAATVYPADRRITDDNACLMD